MLDIFTDRRKNFVIKTLEKLLTEGLAEFHDPTFDKLEEAIEYQIVFNNLSEEEATSLIVSRNFCDLEIILELERLDLVELIEDNYTQITYRLTSKGVEFVRDLKLNRILE